MRKRVGAAVVYEGAPAAGRYPLSVVGANPNVEIVGILQPKPR
jgi:hypothetical protein